jgi:hypothetical protein
MTVDDIRKAIDGLPDDAQITLLQNFKGESQGTAFIELTRAFKSEDRLMISVDVTIADDIDDDDWEDFEKDEDANDD